MGKWDSIFVRIVGFDNNIMRNVWNVVLNIAFPKNRGIKKCQKFIFINPHVNPTASNIGLGIEEAKQIIYLPFFSIIFLIHKNLLFSILILLGKNFANREGIISPIVAPKPHKYIIKLKCL